MLDNVFGISTNSGIQVTFRFGVLLIFASLVSLLAIRLAISLVSCTRVKARKQWDVEPAQDDNQSFIERLLCGCKEEPASSDLLNQDIQRLLQNAKRPPAVDREAREQTVL